MQEIGGYRVIDTLGEGGMGVVYRCHDPRLEREVAVKLLRAGRHATEKQRARFLREARALAKVGTHPNVVTIYDIGEHEECPFLVMAYVPGRSLRDRLDQDGKLRTREALELTLKLARALQHAHEQGIVHRDVKPDNVLLGLDGAPLLTDFGLCRFPSQPSGLTAPGAGLGTLGYLAPEQLEDAMSADARSDVYSLGVTLYVLASNVRPFVGKTTRSIVELTLRGLQAGPSAAAELDPELAAGVDAICLRAAAVRPDERYASANELAQDIERLLRGEAPLATPPPAPPAEDEELPPTDVLEALMDEPLEPPQPGEVDSLAAEGERHFQRRAFRAAAEAFAAAVAHDPQDFELWLRCAVARRKSGDPYQAIDDYARALALKPDSVRVFVGRGAARTDVKDFIGAVADFKRALELLPPGSEKVPRIQSALERAQGRLGDSIVRGRFMDALREPQEPPRSE